ncbi:MAG: glycosyltransferase [Burkholderiales bacterium]
MLRDALPFNAAVDAFHARLAGEGDFAARLGAAARFIERECAEFAGDAMAPLRAHWLRTLDEVHSLAPDGSAAALASALQGTDARLTDVTLSPGERLRLLERAQVIRHLALRAHSVEAAAIPRIVHLVKTDSANHDLPLIPFLCYRSVLAHCRGYRVVLHTPVQPAGPRWEQLLPHLELDIRMPPQNIGAHRLHLAAHQSDVWRVQTLIRDGGFYFDWDLLLLRSPDPLRRHVCVMALEEQVPGYREVLGVSAIGAQPGSVFLQCWLNGMPGAFDPAQYVAHSTVLAREIALQVPTLLRVLPWETFYFPGWTEAAMRWLFDPALRCDEAALQRTLASTTGIHLFASHGHFLRWAESFTEDDIRGRRCNLAMLLQPLLPP